MYRKFSERLPEWKKSPYRKPLLLQGARQVGKTYSVLEFGQKQYDNVVYLNFETSRVPDSLFDDLNPKILVSKLSNFLKQNISKRDTLLFFDEIQICPRALTSLKYFCEFAPEYHIIAAGSLLGVAVNREEFSFPVGKVDRLTVYPLDFEEFLYALGQKEHVETIRICFENNTPMDEYWHRALLEFYHQYLLVGGMPECVLKFVETQDYILIRTIQEQILIDYLDDMGKYNQKNEIKKTRLIYDNITIQLSKKNTRFQYKLIKKGGRAAEFENAIEWLALSGIITPIYFLDTIKKPLDNYKNMDAFKVFVSDIGLLSAKKKLLPEDVLYNFAELDDFKGGMTENYVCNQLISKVFDCYTWHSEGEAELDFIIQKDGAILPIEVKSADNAHAKSLKLYMKRFSPKYAIKISANNFGFENNVKTIPLYAIFCL
ncbi:ATPase [Clostridia bacterium]|nr:ATPase [Clostridia bacterium]